VVQVERGARLERSTEAGLLVLDLGASKALALTVETSGDMPRVRGWAEVPCNLLAQGTLIGLDTARAVLGELLATAAANAGFRPRRVVAGIGAEQVRCVCASGSFRSKLPLVLGPAHLDRALDAAADLGLPSDHEVLHVLPTGYLVDGVRVVKSPLGMRGRSVTAEAAVVTVRTSALDILQRALEGLGYEMVGAAAEPLAAARVALTAEDRQRGAVLIDIGAETTAAAVYRGGVVQSLARVQAGGAHVTRDLAFALQLDLEHAEALKRRAGCALVEAAHATRQVEVQRGRERTHVGEQTLAGIVEARVEEIFAMLRDALRGQRALGLGDRIVLAGGGARLRGAVDLAEQVFESPARLGSPEASCGWPEGEGDAACCTVLGIVEYAMRSGLLQPEAPVGWTRALVGLRRAVRGGRREADRRQEHGAHGAAVHVRGPRPVAGGVDLEEGP
jgi:cell division protein FtsA